MATDRDTIGIGPYMEGQDVKNQFTKSAEMPDHKRRVSWAAYIDDVVCARGVLYDEGNIQVIWRSDIGWTGQQYASISYVIGLMPGINGLKWGDVV